MLDDAVTCGAIGRVGEINAILADQKTKAQLEDLWLAGAIGLACGFPQAHRRRHGKVGQSGQIRRHQGGLIPG